MRGQLAIERMPRRMNDMSERNMSGGPYNTIAETEWCQRSEAQDYGDAEPLDSWDAWAGKPICPRCRCVDTNPDPEENFPWHYRVCNNCHQHFLWRVAFNVMPLNRCFRCGYEWEAGKTKPKTCASPSCRSPRWDQPRVPTKEEALDMLESRLDRIFKNKK